LPVAIYGTKGGRRICLGKIFKASDGARASLGSPYRRRDVPKEVSLPADAVAFLKRAGVQDWIVRLDGGDQPSEAWRVGLDFLLRFGHRRPDGEVYIRLADMEPIEPPQWPYARREMDIPPQAMQLPLPLGSGSEAARVA